MRVGESLVDQQDVGDDQQIAVAHQQARLALALLDHFGGLGIPGHASIDARPVRQDIAQEEIAGAKGIRAGDDVDLLRIARACRVLQEIDLKPDLRGEEAQDEIRQKDAEIERLRGALRTIAEEARRQGGGIV